MYGEVYGDRGESDGGVPCTGNKPSAASLGCRQNSTGTSEFSVSAARTGTVQRTTHLPEHLLRADGGGGREKSL